MRTGAGPSQDVLDDVPPHAIGTVRRGGAGREHRRRGAPAGRPRRGGRGSRLRGRTGARRRAAEATTTGSRSARGRGGSGVPARTRTPSRRARSSRTRIAGVQRLGALVRIAVGEVQDPAGDERRPSVRRDVAELGGDERHRDRRRDAELHAGRPMISSSSVDGPVVDERRTPRRDAGPTAARTAARRRTRSIR